MNLSSWVVPCLWTTSAAKSDQYWRCFAQQVWGHREHCWTQSDLEAAPWRSLDLKSSIFAIWAEGVWSLWSSCSWAVSLSFKYLWSLLNHFRFRWISVVFGFLWTCLAKARQSKISRRLLEWDFPFRHSVTWVWSKNLCFLSNLEGHSEERLVR